MTPQPSLGGANGPLGDDWREVLDAVARREKMVTSDDPKRVAAALAKLSAAYNDRSAKAPAADDRGSLNARLLFSFPRDVPKGSAAVRELRAAGRLPTKSVVTLLDIGAGLGAMTWGIARALPAGTELDAELTDRHSQALALAAAITRERNAGTATPDHATVRMRTRVAPAEDAGRGRFDLVVAGQVLSELDRDLEEPARLAKHVALVRRWLERVADDGSLVIVEPALRDRTRHLHHLRAALIAAGVTVFAPCLHAGACPMLVRETDWCHEDLPIDLPEWLIPIARAASLRFEGLTFSYLVLRRDGATLGGELPFASAFREVSGPLRTKGKLERTLCGRAPGLGGGGLRVMRLDRVASQANALWDEAHRGDLLAIDPPLDVDRPRIDEATVVVPAKPGLTP